ncbi:MAG: diguanylate cyclase [Pseudomonadaceae bacterium]|nr:diguanylate cyclase [Pseudomonadaceae bacterium]
MLAERIRCEFAAAAPGAQSVSVGVAGSPDGGYDLSRLLSLADRALYAAKGAGRNRVAVQGADGEPTVAHSR